MRIRTTLQVVALAACVVAVGAAPVAAQTAGAEAGPGSYRGTAASDALTLKLFGQTITTSAATAEVSSAPLAKATASEVLLGPVGPNGQQTAETRTPGQTVQRVPSECTGNGAEALPGVTRLDITCPQARAALAAPAANGGSARGLGAEAVLDASVSEVLSTLQLQEPLQNGTQQTFEQALDPIVEALVGNPVGDALDAGVTTVEDVLTDVLGLQATARVVVAPALAQVDVTPTLVTSQAQAQGLRIELLPADGAGATNNLLPEDLEAGEPLVTITIGNAKVKKTAPRDGSKGTTEATAATATIDLGTTALSEQLGLPTEPISVAIGQTVCLFEGTPLESCVSLADAGVDANGNPFADGATVQLLKGAQGGIELAVGRAGSGGTVTATATPAPAPAPAGQLPRTGGVAVPLVGIGLVAAAAGVRRLTRGAAR